MTRVYVLGSGFSKAVAEEMPTLWQLSQTVHTYLREEQIPGANTPVAYNFEQWLSYLADPAPWLDLSSQLRNQAAFVRVAAAVGELLDIAQIKVSLRPPPAWLIQLVEYWEYTSATVLTFNYDVLIEAAWLASARGGQRQTVLYPVPLTPAAARIGAAWASPPRRTGLRLLKLHGSLTWRYSGPGSPPGDPVFDIGLLGPDDTETDRHFQYASDEDLVIDKEPMIVPPTALKSQYYGNHIITSLWRQAAAALRDADELILMGFSIPPTDQVVGTMFSTELATAASVVPVDPNPQVVERLQTLLEPVIHSDPDHACRVVDAYVGRADPIQRWVNANANIAEPPTSPATGG